MELNKLPKTRSGRRVKPPMAWWANQRVVVYPFTEIVEIKPPTPSHLSDSHLSDSIIHFKEDTVRPIDRLSVTSHTLPHGLAKVPTQVLKALKRS